MTRIATAILALLLCAGVAFAAQFGDAQYPIKADDGEPMANFDLGAALSARLEKLPGKIAVGNVQGDVTLMQFYDLNCPFCREAAADVAALVGNDKKLKLVFVPYPVLSVASVQGALVELEAAKLLTPEQYLQFHRRIYAERGLINVPRVLAAARDFGLDEQKLSAAAMTEANLAILKEGDNFGKAAKLIATPSYVIGGVAILGHPGLQPLQDMVKAVRACGKVVC
jgi:protein-disulfide isomerase